MVLAQHGAGNGISWTQTGSGLADLGVTQTGGSQLAITQGWGPGPNGTTIPVTTGLPK